MLNVIKSMSCFPRKCKVTSSPIDMLWGILFLLTAHVLIPDAALAQDSHIAPTPGEIISSSPSSAVASTGKSDDLVGNSVVVNWKLTCQQLCGANLGGPACGLACLNHQVTRQSDDIDLNTETRDAVCPTLCENGLGSKICGCNLHPSNIGHNHSAVCQVFCAATKIQLNGCSQCSEQFSDADVASDVGSTTPNWDELCTVWCKMGEGGTLCNCDLPPFV